MQSTGQDEIAMIPMFIVLAIVAIGFTLYVIITKRIDKQQIKLLQENNRIYEEKKEMRNQIGEKHAVIAKQAILKHLVVDTIEVQITIDSGYYDDISQQTYTVYHAGKKYSVQLDINGDISRFVEMPATTTITKIRNRHW